MGDFTFIIVYLFRFYTLLDRGQSTEVAVLQWVRVIPGKIMRSYDYVNQTVNKTVLLWYRHIVSVILTAMVSKAYVFITKPMYKNVF